MTLREGTPPEKREQVIDLTIAHWCLWGPGRSGMYETVKELILAENKIPGVMAGLVNPESEKGGESDGWITSQSHGWAYETADVNVIHWYISGYGGRLKPAVFMIHGTPEACLQAEPKSGSFTAALNNIPKYDATIVMSRRHEAFWKKYDATGSKIYYVPKGIDLTRWTPKGMYMELDGAPKIVYGEVWRGVGIKTPHLLYHALDEYYKRNDEMRFHQFGTDDSWMKVLNRIVIQGGFTKWMGKYFLAGRQLFPDSWYRGGDMTISLVIAGEPSRVQKEALACGCPTITWDTNPYPDNFGFYQAKAFDEMNLADTIDRLWSDIQSDPMGVKEKARRIAENHYDMTIMAGQVVDILRTVVDRA